MFGFFLPWVGGFWQEFLGELDLSTRTRDFQGIQNNMKVHDSSQMA